MVIPGQPATVVSYSAEPDFQFVVAMGIFVWFWIMGVYGYGGMSTPWLAPSHLFLFVDFGPRLWQFPLVRQLCPPVCHCSITTEHGSYYVAASVGRVSMWTNAHVCEGAVEAALSLLCAMGAALGFKRAAGYRLFPGM